MRNIVHDVKVAPAKTRRAIRLTLVGCFLVAVLLGFFFIRQMNGVVNDSMVANMRELSAHDIASIEGYLGRNLDELERAGERLRIQRCTTVQRALETVNLERASSSFEKLYLVTEDGRLYSDTFMVYGPGELPYADGFSEGTERFVRREDAGGRYLVQQLQSVAYGASIRPYRVGDVTFTGVVGTNNINSIRSSLKVESFDGEGFSSLIDSQGDFIVDVESVAAVRNDSNFFDELRAGSVEGGMTEELIGRIRGGSNEVFKWRSKDGQEMVSVAQPLPDTDWLFVMTVPSSLLVSRSMTLVVMTGALLVGVALAMVVAFVLVLRWQRRTTADRAANQARSEFLSSLSHEIRTPLNGLVGLNHLMRTHLDDRDLMVEYTTKADETTRYLLSLVNDALDMSKLESGQFKILREPMDVAALIDEVLTMQRDVYRSRGVALEVDCTIDSAYLLGDKLHLKQVIMNILGNAAKFTPEGGRVDLSVRQRPCEHGEVLTSIAVADTGIGMTPEFLEHIFVPFAQERDRSTESQKGTGLGMSISRLLMEQMGGDIKVESELGKGSVFTVTFRAKACEAPEPEVASAPEEEAEARPLTVLLAEDNELNAAILMEMLEDEGHTVVRAADGEQAVEAFAEAEPGTFDLVLMDLQMPRLDGYGATRRIRALDRPDAVDATIFACSANTYQEDRDAAVKAGMNGFLEKPIQFDKLFGLLAALGK